MARNGRVVVLVNELSIWAGAHGTRGDLGVFRSVADLGGYLQATDGYTDVIVSVESGDHLIATIESLRGIERIDHLVLAGHGGTTWWMDSEHGVSSSRLIDVGVPMPTVSAEDRELGLIPRRRQQGQVDVWELAAACVGVLSDDPLISLAACMCSRSPRWYLLQRYGTVGSDWGPRAYQPGGLASFSARLRDALQDHGMWARVRGHRAAGHASALALLAQHSGMAGTQCETLFGRALGGIEPTAATRRWWIKTVTGLLAQRWLMGDDSVEAEIRAAWLASH